MHISNDKTDRLFSEKLGNQEVTPRKQAWEKLESRLQQKQKKIVPLWQKMAIAASVLLVLFAGSIGFYKNNSDNTITQPDEIAQTPIVKPIEKKIDLNTNQNILAVEQYNVANKAARNFKKPVQTKEQNIEKIIAPNYTDNIDNSIAKIEQPAIKNEANELKNIELAENSKPTEAKNIAIEQKEEELTVVFTLANFENNTNNISESFSETNKEKKPKYLSRFFKQLINAKNGDRVDWNDMGFKPAKILARAENKLKGTKDEINDSYQTVKNKTVL